MRKLPGKNPLWKWIAGYGLIILFGKFFLFPSAWSGVNRFLVLSELAKDSSFQSEVKKITGEDTSEKDKDFWKRLSDEKKEAVKVVVRERFEKVDWLPVHLLVNLITFSILGLLSGIFLRGIILSGIIPLFLSLSTLPVLGSVDFMVGSKYITIAVGLSTQLIAVYLFSYLGFRTKERIIQKKSLKEGTTSPNDSQV